MNRQWGSYFFLACYILTGGGILPVEFGLNRCPKGIAALARLAWYACPTVAFPEPYVIDAAALHQLTALTIEYRESIDPESGRIRWGDLVFRLRLCASGLIPWNRPVSHLADDCYPRYAVAAFGAKTDLIEIIRLDPSQFREQLSNETPTLA